MDIKKKKGEGSLQFICYLQYNIFCFILFYLFIYLFFGESSAIERISEGAIGVAEEAGAGANRKKENISLSCQKKKKKK